MFQYYDKIVKGTDREDMLVILQSLAGMIGEKFSFLNYYKEIPVSYDATLLSIENEMAEFAIHEYQAKVISFERKALIQSHPKFPFSEDIVGEAFYVNSIKKRSILCKFAYARIRSQMRKFVRVMLDCPVEADLIFEGDVLKGNVKDLSLGGAAINVMSSDLLVPGQEIKLSIKLPDLNSNKVNQVAMTATVLNVIGECAPFTCIIEFHTEKLSQQQISYYINQRQVEIIKELKESNA